MMRDGWKIRTSAVSHDRTDFLRENRLMIVCNAGSFFALICLLHVVRTKGKVVAPMDLESCRCGKLVKKHNEGERANR